ncbi:MAG: hypothetical protein KatS3mg079_152 [Caloramator sp.]|uniref:DUF3006 domain-containing protein n=1 Tax=Caloramator proteoclasticus DSM 10124 TaxID=1121262 RepID=A0A1M4S703_9CLOT|nr:DUF3006 domain-containing protein [Caloramator proteoclasticus]GIW48676.1 MAG: hypothetical protein KatS3mg079_152 [Caloramator sp.]SHE27996.1 Protein of unknown function [Caloramator proteoclasticus DSM 10124]
MKGVVDRIEGNVVVIVLDDEDVVEVDIKNFDNKVTEGDVVYKGVYNWVVDEEETLKRKKEVENYLKLFDE